jgi:hypothetical protein
MTAFYPKTGLFADREKEGLDLTDRITEGIVTRRAETALPASGICVGSGRVRA